MEKLTKENFNDVILNGKVLIDFNATWCGPCRMLHPILEKLENELNDVKIYSVDVDDNEDLARQFGIMSIPSLILFDNGNIVDKKIGFMDYEQLLNWLK